jgi:ELWxxDGT repeat protein/cysteine-rich repeat protein
MTSRGASRLARLALAVAFVVGVSPVHATVQSDGGPAPSFLKNVDGKLFFATYEAAGWRIWTSDGTEAGTVSLASGLGLDVELVAVHETLVFSSRGALWKSNGTVAGTSVVVHLPFYPNGIKADGNAVYFSDGQGELWYSDLTVNGTGLIVDVDPGYVFHDLTPAAITNVRGRIFFRAIDFAHGNELWTTDGSPSGSHVIDVNPSGGSAPSAFTSYQGQLLFAADGGDGYELWRADGTGQGAVEVKEINPTGDAWPMNLRVVGQEVFFSADDGRGAELWKTNGTSDGTSRVADINPTGGSYPNALLNVDGTLYFRADDGTSGIELWKSDGTAAGTERVADINPTGNSVPASLHQIKGRLFFTADDGVHGEELWTSDGTAEGTMMVADLDATGSSQPHYLVNVDDVLYFAATDGVNGTQLWTLDCTPEGWPCTPRMIALPSSSPRAQGGEPYLVKDIYPGPGDGEPYYLAGVGRRLFFQAFRPDTGIELWTSDGTGSGTTLVRDLNPGPADSHPHDFTDVNGTAFFLADSPTEGSGLWKSDGTAAGTALVHGAVDSSYVTPSFSNLTPYHGLLYYVSDALGSTGIWKTDGTIAGTELVLAPGNVETMAVVGDVLYFIGGNPLPARPALWRSDGTPGGSMILRTLPIKGGTGLGQLTAAGNLLFFRAGEGLWRSDGTVDGTFSVLGGRPKAITAVGSRVFFSAEGGEGRELWVSDGTLDGTTLVADINLGPADGMPGPDRLTNVDGKLFFWATDGATGFELWTSDGTAPGTHLVRDVDPTDVTVPSYFQAVGNLLYFTAHTPSFGYELWRSDGTFDGTYIVKNINLVRSSYPESPANVAGTLFFYADDGRVGEELWALAPCGDGEVNPGEECDDGNLVSHDGCSDRCVAEPIELCGNCTDDDDDGLVDLDDPDCCAATGTLSIEQWKIGKRRGRRTLRLEGTIGGLDLGAPAPAATDVAVQIEPEFDEPVCARIPADHLRAAGRALRFEDPKATLTTAKGIARLAIRRRKTGQLRVIAAGKPSWLEDGLGDLSIVLGFGPDGDRRCTAPARVDAGVRRVR